MKLRAISADSLRKRVKNILIVFPSNFGDLFMCFPSVEYVRGCFPSAKISAVVSPRTKDFIMHVDIFDAVIEFKKEWDWIKKFSFASALRGRYQAVFDFKNSLIPLFVQPLAMTSLLRAAPTECVLQKDIYLYYTKKALPQDMRPQSLKKADCLLEQDTRLLWDHFFQRKVQRKAAFICFASNDLKKNYPWEKYAQVAAQLRRSCPVVLVGKKEDVPLAEKMMQSLPDTAMVWDLTGKTQLWDLYYILREYAAVFIGNDSGIMHMSSYLNIPTIGVYGPTSPVQFSPWSDKAKAVFSKERCVPCPGTNKCQHWPAKCIVAVPPEDVIKAAEELLK